MSDYLLHTVNRLRTLPGVLQWRKRRFDHRFESDHEVGNCRGVFNSYRSAATTAPPTRPLDYDNADAAAMYRERLDHIYPSDYPMMLWLQRAFDEGVRRALDLGGHVGIAFYAYQKFLPFPEDVHWTVSDVPAVVRAGPRPGLRTRAVRTSALRRRVQRSRIGRLAVHLGLSAVSARNAGRAPRSATAAAAVVAGEPAALARAVGLRDAAEYRDSLLPIPHPACRDLLRRTRGAGLSRDRPLGQPGKTVLDCLRA